MRVLEVENLGTKRGGDIWVSIRVLQYSDGYSVELKEKGKRWEKIPKLATGLPTQELAMETKKLFVQGYCEAERQDPDSDFEEVV